MAKPYRSPYDPEVQDQLTSFPVAPEQPTIDVARAQTLARSSSNPAAQRAGQSMLDEASRQQERAARESEMAQRQADRQAESDAKAAAKEMEAERARNVRAGAAAGLKTTTDIETGKRTIDTLSDGAPAWKTGPVGKPVTIPAPTPKLYDMPTMLEKGALAPPKGPDSVVQTYRNEQGETVTRPLPTTTDPKTGAVTAMSRKDEFGAPVKQELGTDPVVAAKVAKDAELEQRRQSLALRKNAVAQERLRFQPKWEPAKKEFDAASKDLNSINEKPFRRNAAGKWEKFDPATNRPVFTDPAEVAVWQQSQKQAQERVDRAKKSHDTLYPVAENLNRNETQIEEARLKLAEEKIRHDTGMPAEAAGTLTRILASGSADVTSDPEADAARAVVGGAPNSGIGGAPGNPPPTPDGLPPAPGSLPPSVQAPSKPLVPLDDTGVMSAAFGGLVDPKSLTVSHTGDGYRMIQRNGQNIGNIVDSDGAPVVVLNAGPNEDLRGIAALGGTTGTAVYLADGKRQPLAKEAAWAAQAFQLTEQATALPFGFNEMLQTPGTVSPVADIDGQLKTMGADLPTIIAKVTRGEISMQVGEALAKGLYQETLQATDPLKPESIKSYLDANPEAKQTWESSSKGTAEKAAVVSGYVSDWYAKNQHKPGVTWSMMQAARKGLDPGNKTLGEKAKDVGGIITDAGGSMIGLLAAYPTLAGMGAGVMAQDAFGEGSDGDLGTAYREMLDERGRANKNFVRGLETNRKKWFTAEGKKSVKDLENALLVLQRTNATRDVYPDGAANPQWKADVSAQLEAVTDAAFALHSLNQEDGWEMSRDDVNANKNRVLKATLGNFLETGDPDAWQQFQRRLLLDKGSLQSEQYSQDITAGSGRFASAVIGGATANDFEAVVEILSDVVTMGAASVIAKGAKVVTASKLASAGRVARFGRQAVKEFHEIGMAIDTLAKPASTLGKVSNVLVKGAKAGSVNALTEGVEEGVSAIGDPTANRASVAEQMAVGGLMGLVLAPVMVAPSMLAANSRENYSLNKRVSKLVDEYNKAGVQDPGFKPIGREDAIAAMQLADNPARKVASEKLESAKIELQLAQNELGGTQAGLLNVRAQGQEASAAVPGDQNADTTTRADALKAWQADNASQEQAAQGRVESAASRFSRALGAFAEASNDMTNILGTAMEVAQEAKGKTPAERASIIGLAKVGLGRPDLLTSGERSAIAGKQTDEGLPYFEAGPNGTEILSDAARAEVQAKNPVLGRHLATPESTALFEAAKAQSPTPTTNEPNTQGTPGQKAPAKNPQPTPADSIAPGGVVPDGTGSAGNAGGTGSAPAEKAPVKGNAAESQIPGASPANSRSAPIQPAESPAKSKATSAIARATKRFPKLADVFSFEETAGTEQSGGAFAVDGGIVINLPDLEKDLAGYTPEKQDARLDAILDEEIVHLAQFEAVKRAGETIQAFYAGLWNEFTPEQKAAAANTYQSSFAQKSPWEQAAETVRILIQQKSNGQVTELTKAFSRDMPERLIQLLKDAVKFLKEIVAKGEISARIQDTITGIESILAEYQSTNAERNDQKSTNALEEAVSDNISSETVTSRGVENLRDATETIRKAVVAARKQFPELRDTDLGFDLEDIAFDMAETLAGIPADERKSMVENAIAAWLEANTAKAPIPAGQTSDQRANRKAWRQAAQEKLTAKARAFINSGVPEAFYAVFQRGRITPMPNIIGLIRKRRDEGKVLTQKEIEVWRNESEWNGALKKSNYTGGGQNPMARAMIDLIMARQGDGQMPNTIADDLLPKITTASEMWEALAKELRAVTSGKEEDKAGYDPMDDPNYEPTDAEIAAWEAKQEAVAQKQESQPHVTLDDAHGYAIEAFGPDAPITQKLGVVAELSDRIERGSMPDVRAAVEVEFQRHARGEAIVESPSTLSGQAAKFLAFLRAHTPESLRAGLESLPVVDAGSALYSSPTNARPTVVVKAEIPADFPAVENGVKPMVKWAKENIKGAWPSDALGADVEVTSYGINHTAAQLARSPKRMRIIAALPSLIRNARIVTPQIGKNLQIYALAEIEGEMQLARITIEERTGDSRGPWNRFYDIKQVETENVLDAMSAFPSVTEGSLLAIPGREVTLEQLSEIVNKAEGGTRLSSSPTPETPGRFRPKTLVEFKRPITGPSGAKLAAYEWKYRLEEGLDKRGEDAAVRVSNWNESMTNDATGREVVHQFHVEMPDGKSQVVSLETALELLGYTTKNAPGSVKVKSLASVVKTRARNLMELGPLEAESAAVAKWQDTYDRARSNVDRRNMPEMTVDIDEKDQRAWGRGEFRLSRYFPGVMTNPSEYDLRQFADRTREGWIDMEAKKISGKSPQITSDLDSKITDLKRRIKKADAKIEEITSQEALATTSPQTSIAPSEFGFNQTTDAGTASQKGFNFDSLPAGPNAKFIENTQKAFDNATSDRAREEIAKASAAREGLSRGKVQNVPQGMMDFGMSGSFGTKDQPGLFSSPTNQRSFDFGTDASFDTKKQMGFDFRKTVDAPANEAATSPANATPEPTDAQKKAGNYKVGRVNIGGMDISIENPAGSTRSGTNKSGKRWEVIMASHYGYLRGTKGKDGDHIDIFIQEGTPLDYVGPVFVVNQNAADGTFDEHKAVMGPDITTEDQAKAEYLRNYSPGWKGAGSIAKFESVDAFREWATERRRIAPAKTETATGNLIQQAQAEFEKGLPARIAAAETKLRKTSPDGFTRQEAIRIIGYDESRVVIPELEKAGKITWQAKDAPMMDQTASEGWKWAKATTAPEPNTPDFRLLPREDKAAIVRAKTEAKAAEKAGITDFGEKIGGARKDISTKTGESTRAKKTSDKPGWFNRYEIGEVVAELKPESPLESYLARSASASRENSNSEVGRFVITDKRKLNWHGKPERATRQSFATREEAEAFIPVIEVSRNHRVRSEKDGDSYRYGIWRTITDRKRVQVVKQTFETEKEAMEFMVKNATDIIETKTSWREELIVKPEKAVRKGPDRRNGLATPEMFQNAFGFRGVEFGNWMRQVGDGKERQEVLNHAYDGLLDLAELLGIPPKAISLNGELGLAFGARGQGLSGAKAHYEPDYVVINLTKMSGAGSLAHEWIHALDHYLGRQDGRASSQWIKNGAGDMVLQPGAFENNAVSSGFSRDSNVREEVKNVFIRLMDTIMTKAVEYVEDSNNAERFVAVSRKALEDHLASMRKDYTREPDLRWEKRRKVATTAQLALFDSIADRLINGQDLGTEWRAMEGGKSKYGIHRWTNDTLEQLGVLHKAITNRTGFDKERNGTLDNLRGYMGRYADRIKMLESAAASETKVKKVPTDFSMNAKRIDQGSASDYWNVPHEMLARGFSAYVEDRITTSGGTSDFLSYGSDNRLAKYRMFNVKPFPEGTEREAINERFDQLFDVIESEETEKGVRLFSSPSQPDLFAAANAPDATQKLGQVKVGTMSALGAYRTLTAKRNAGKTLTADEEQKLLSAEQALGQKLAFDMEAVKGSAHEMPLTAPAAPVPVFGQNRREGQDEMSRAGEIDRSGQISLLSSPTPPDQIDWKKFPPVFRSVYADILAGKSLAQTARDNNLRERAIPNILNSIGVRAQALDEAAAGTLAPKMKDGLLERGRPERALSTTSPEVARILQIREDANSPEAIANAETYDNAKRMIAADYQGTIERITNRRANGEDLTLDEVAAAQMILIGKVGKKRAEMTMEEKVQLGWLAMDWVEQGTDDARRLQIRRDVTHSPAERAALYFAKELYTPQDAETVKALKNAKGRKAKEEVMSRFLERSEGLKARLLEQGIDIEASLEEYRRQQDKKQAMEEAVKQAHDRLTGAYQDEVNALQQQLSKANAATAAAEAVGIVSEAQIAKMKADAEAMAEKLKKARTDLNKARMLEPGLVLRSALLNLNDAEKAAMETLLNGGTIENALAVGGMTQEKLKKIYIDFGNVLKKARLEAQALAKQRMLEMPPVLMSSSMEADELRMVGYVPWGELEARKAPITPEQVKIKPRKPKAKAPEIVVFTPEQEAAIDAAFERFKNADPSTWSTLFETESKNLTPLIGQIGFEEFKGKALQPWRDRWQTEMDGIANPAARMTFEEWIDQPTTRETAKRERTLFPQPINETTGTFDTTVPNREGSLFPQPINEITGTWRDTRPYTAQGQLMREEISTTTGMLDFNDPISVRNALREISTGRSSAMDRIMEWWRAAILSGPQTAIVNTASNLSFGGFNMGPRRLVEASVNSVLKLAGIGSNESADFGEFVAMARHLRGAAKLAGIKMLQSWREESANFKAYALATENQLNFGGKDWEQFEPAIPGKLGTLMRSISFRHMQAADELMKFFFGHVEVAAQAHRIAKAEGLKGNDYRARIDDLIERKGSEAWKKTYTIMQRNTFQEKMVPLSDTAASIRIFDTLAMKAKNARKMPYLGRPITFFLPFIDTPTNIAKQAVELSPLGGVLALIDGSRALKRRLSAGKLNSDGMRISKEEAQMAAAELYDKERFVKDLTNQAIAWGIYFAIAEMVGGDNDDDLPLITGTMAYTITKRGERDVADRVMPPQSIRFPGTNTFMSYSRLDPFATIMAGMVDMTRSINREGGFNSKVATDFMVHTKNAMKDKTFLTGVSNIINALEDPSRVMERLSASILTGFVPNLIRQPIREADTARRDTNPREGDGLAASIAKRIGYSIVPSSAPQKIDVWGNDLPANTGEMIGGHPVANAIFRTLDPTNLTVGAKIDPLDLYIFTWNNQAQDSDKISIMPIDDFVTGAVNGKSTKLPLTVEEQAAANRNVGRQAHDFLSSIGLDHRAATKEGAEQITDTFRQLQKIERERLRNEKLAAMPETK